MMSVRHDELRRAKIKRAWPPNIEACKTWMEYRGLRFRSDHGARGGAKSAPGPGVMTSRTTARVDFRPSERAGLGHLMNMECLQHCSRQKFTASNFAKGDERQFEALPGSGSSGLRRPWPNRRRALNRKNWACR